MNKEQYVTFKVAKLLKKKWFDWPCIHYYDDDGTMHEALDYVRQNDGEDDDNDECLCPTQQMACRWLMEEKHIFIGKSFTKNEETLNLEFYSPIFNMDTCELITTIGAFCPEDAIEAALEYILTNLI